MIDFYINYLKLINLQVFLVSALLFFIGYALAPTVYFRNVKWLLAYPMWMFNKMDNWAEKKWNGYVLFLLLFSMNTFSLAVDLLSGWVIFLPVVFAVWTGMNVGVITYHTLHGEFYYASLINPVVFLELPAAFLAFSMALQMNLAQVSADASKTSNADFSQYIILFIITVLPLLFISGIVESALILYARKLDKSE
jgi:uncharacterized membrane protein SpoIIM required for sporulation